MPAKRYLLAAAVAAVVGLLSCVDGDTPTGVDATGVARLAIIPTFSPAVASTAAQPREINRIRVTATKASDGAVLVVHQQDVDPNATGWTLDIEVPVPEDGSQVILTIELIHVEGGQETVEWSGQTAPVSVSAGQSSKARAIEVVRGPTANLGVTSVTVTPDTVTIEETDTVRITAQVATTGPEDPVVFWASLDSTASVAGDGVVTGLLPGFARIVGVAGGVADTAKVTVLSKAAGVVVTPDSVVVDSAGSIVTFEGSVVDARGDPVPGQEVVWASRDTTRVESLEDGQFRAFGPGRVWIEARAVPDTALVDSALVAVVVPEADLVITKASEITQVSPGDTIEFLITVQNLGPDSAGAFRVVDHAPEGLTPLADSTSRGTSVLDSLLWRVGGLAVEGLATWTVRFVAGPEIAAEPIAFNSVRIDEHETFDPDADNNSATYELSVFGGADVGVEMTTRAAEPRVGDRITVELAIDNYGPLTARDISVLPVFSPGLKLVNVTVDVGSFDTSAGVWAVPELERDQGGVAVMALDVTDPSTPDVLWEITASSRHADSDSLGFDYNPGNDTTSLNLGVAPALADIQVIKTVDQDTVTVGVHATFLVQVINHGPGVARGIVVRDSMDAGFTPVVIDSTHLMAGTPDSLVADSIAVGDTAWASLTTVADTGTASTTLWNRAWVLAHDRSSVDPDTLNNADSASVYVRRTNTDLEVLKTVSRDTVVVGDSLIYEVRLINHGPKTVDSVVVVDFVDEWALNGFASRANTFARSSTLGSPTGDTLVSGILTAGDTATLRWIAFVDTVAAGDTIWNDVHIESVFGAIDTTLTNDKDSVWSWVTPLADLAVMKWVDDSAPFEGDSVTFTVVVENFGPGTATSVRIQEAPDSGFSDVALVSLTGGVMDTLTGIWSLDSIPSGVADTVTLRMTVDSGTVADTLWNRAWSLGLTSEVDPEATNDTASVSVVVDQKTLDISVLKSIDNSEPYEGDTIKFTVVVDNFGPDSAADVQIQERLDSAGFAPVNVVVTNGTFDTLTGNWDIGPMGSGASDTLVLTAVIDSGTVSGTLWNRAFVGPILGAVETDSTNNADSVSVTVGQRQADLALHKFVDSSAPFEGDTITYLVELQNFGTHTARNVQVFDSLSVGLTQLSDTATRGLFDLPTRTWTVDSIAPGETDTLTLKVRVDSGTVAQTLWNRAGAYGLTHAVETDPLNDTVSVEVTVDQKTADLNLVKTSDRASAPLGDTIEYQVVLENWGSHPATGVAVLDTLPSQLTWASDSATLGSYDPGTHTWTVGTVPVGGADTLFLKAVVTSVAVGDTVWNVARLQPLAAEVDPDLANNTDSVAVGLDAVDLAVAKTVSKDPVIESDSLTYEISVMNPSTLPATNVVISDTLPTGVTYGGVRFSSRGTYNSTSGDWSVGTVNPGDSLVIEIWVRVDPGTAGTTPANIAFLKSLDQVDTDPANNTAQIGTTVTGADYFKIAKTVSKDPVIESDSLTYEISVMNTTVAPATNVVVSDTLPTGMTFGGVRSSSRGSYNSTTGDWTIGTVDPGDSLVLRIWVRVDPGTAGSTPANIAFLKAVDQTDIIGGNNGTQVSTTVTGADYLQLAKTVSKDPVIESDSLTYEISVMNHTVAPVTNVVVSDTMPMGMTYGGVRFSSRGSYNSTNGDWTIGTVDPGDSLVLRVWVRPDPGISPADPNNIAFVKGLDQTDTAPANDTVKVSTTVTGADYLQLAKTVSKATVIESDTLTYEISLKNRTTAPVTGVIVRDTLPTGVTFGGVRFSSRGGYNSTTGDWSIGPVDPGDSLVMRIWVTVDPGMIESTLTNIAFVDGMDQGDSNTANNTAQASSNVMGADYLRIAKTGSKASMPEGDTITYEISVTNSTVAPTTNVVVSDTLPTGMTFGGVRFSARGTYNSTSGDWSIGTVNPGDSLVLRIWATAAAGSGGTSPNNIAFVKSLDQTDVNGSNNTAGSATAVPGVDIEVTKIATNLTPAEGEIFEYRVVARNIGVLNATGIEVYDTIPPEFEYISVNSSQSQGTYSPSTGRWTVGNLTTGGDSAWAIMSVRPLPGSSGSSPENIARVALLTETQANFANDTAKALVTIGATDYLQVTKTALNATPAESEEFDFRIVARNLGPDTITGVIVADTLPAGLTRVTQTTTQGGYNTATRIWSPGTLAAGDSAVMTMTATADSATAGIPLSNTARGHVDQTDSSPANDTASAVVTPTGADYLRISKSVSDASPSERDTVVYTVKIKNIGPGGITGVEVFDTVPAGLTLLANSESQGLYQAAQGRWQVGDIAMGDSATLTIDAQVDLGTLGNTIWNTARAYSDQTETNTVNDSISVSLYSSGVDIAVNKIFPDSMNVQQIGDTIQFTVVAWNLGPDPATNVQIHEAYPAILAHVSNVPSQGTYDDGTKVWSVGSLAAGDTVSMTFNLAATDTATDAGNHVSVFGVTEYQADPLNDTITKVVTVAPDTVDVSVIKTVTPASTPNVGDTLTYTINVSQYTSAAGTILDLLVHDTLPTGLTFLSAAPSTGTYNGTEWSIPMLPESTSVNMTLKATVDSASVSQTLLNIASLRSTSSFVDTFVGNNTDTAAVTVSDPVAMSITKTADKTNPQEGDVVVFRLTVTDDNGGDFVTPDSLLVLDTLPTGLTYSAQAAEAGTTYDQATGIWNIDWSAVGFSATLDILATVDAGTAGSTLTNTAEIVYTSPVDDNPGNDTASVSVTPRGTDVALIKDANEPDSTTWYYLPLPDRIIYKLRVANNGSVPVTNVVVHDSLPAEVSAVKNMIASTGTPVLASGVITWTIPTILAGDTVTLDIEAEFNSLLDPDTIFNVARIMSLDQTDTLASNDRDTHFNIAIFGGAEQQDDALDFAFADYGGIGAPGTQPGVALPGRRDEVTTTRRSPALDRPRRSRGFAGPP